MVAYRTCQSEARMRIVLAYEKTERYGTVLWDEKIANV
jgi:hypothetical protein